MDTKLCRICGKLSENYVHLFKTEGLKNKIETCLPIIVSPHCLLPDTICSECLENVDNFYSFIKNCLQNIIVLEAQYDIMESCLKTKRKHEKGCSTDLVVRFDKNVQTDEDFTELQLCKEEDACFASRAPCYNYLEMEKLNAALVNAENIILNSNVKHDVNALVSYDVESGGESDYDCREDEAGNAGKVVLIPKAMRHKVKLEPVRTVSEYSALHKRYFDDAENDLITEIAQRKDLKRKCDTILPHRTKIFKMDTGSRRKSRQPMKVESYSKNDDNGDEPNLTFNNLEKIYKEMERNNLTLPTKSAVGDKQQDYTEEDRIAVIQQVEKEINSSLPQLCLLCDVQFTGPTTLAAHVYEMHGIDMAQVLSSEPVLERKKKIPNLVKIADLKTKNDNHDGTKEQPFDDPPTLQPTFVCPICPAVLTNRSDLFTHLKMKHSKHAALMCGLCLHLATTYMNLTKHLETCRPQHPAATSKYVCRICAYHDDNSKAMENHVGVHDFVLAFCKKQAKMFDPCDYVDVNPSCESAKSLTCTECNQGNFVTFKEFSTHRRSQHQIFHCDLCNKFYGRNSHLWKHVNRLHKGHPSITCQLCYKTSASKYHLAQHFNKIHSAKPFKQKQVDGVEDSAAAAAAAAENFMAQKFQGFDFQSVRQSFMRQELLEQERKFVTTAPTSLSDEGNSDGDDVELYPTKDGKLNIKREVKTETVTHEVDCSDLEFYGDDYESREANYAGGDLAKVKKEQPPVSPPKEIDASSDLYTNIITNYTPPQNEGEYKCPKCLKGFHKKTLLKKHKKNCRPRLQKDLLTRCKTCSRIFKDRQSLTKHLVNYHSEYACEICGQKVQSKCEIVSHIRFSHPCCHLYCHCGNILRSKVDLAEHKRDHRNSFVCQFCADMLPTKIKLKMHILSLHRKILSLSCGICLKLFETQHILRDHVRLVHRDELSPLTSCTVCGKNYGSKWKTYDHLNKSHGRIFKACKACLDVFDTEDELQMHFDTTHIHGSSLGGKSNNMTGGHNSAPNANAAARKDVYESDACDEHDDKNSSSEFSNDAEAFVHYHGMKEPNLSEDDEAVPQIKLQDLTEMSGQESKISLLEKRLLGSHKSIEPDPNAATVPVAAPQDKTPSKHKLGVNHNPSTMQKKVKGDSYETPPKPPKEASKEKKPQKPYDPDAELDPSWGQNPLQNSSKRTVYVNSNDPSLCEICLKTWPAKKHLWQHYIRCHKTVAATVCGICLKTNDSYESLQTHLRETHPTLLHGQGFGSNFICRICGRYHNASSKLRLHMAIHENFDWGILVGAGGSGGRNTFSPYDGQGGRVGSKENASNGYLEDGGREAPSDEALYYMNMGGGLYGDVKQEHDDEGINYESLIEQVECSSDSESDDVEMDPKEAPAVNSSSVDDDDDEEEESDNESVISVLEENSLESRMLQNMLQEKFAAGPPNNLRQAVLKRPGGGIANATNSVGKQEYSSSDTDDSSDSGQSPSDDGDDVEQVRSSSDDDEGDSSEFSKNSESLGAAAVVKQEEEPSGDSSCEMEGGGFARKPEELDSAIRSISYEQVADVRETVDDDLCEIQPQTLNQREIQSAVDSIL